MSEKRECPSCGRQIGVLADGRVRRHNVVETGALCAGGVGLEGNVTAIGSKRRRGGPRQAGKLPPSELEAANELRPQSKQLGRSGLGVCGGKNRRQDKTNDTCMQAKGYRTDHPGWGRCNKHGGTTANGKKHAALERARSELNRVKGVMQVYGSPVKIDPETALLNELERTEGAIRWLMAAMREWGEVERMSAELADLEADLDGRDPADTGAQALAEQYLRRIMHAEDQGQAITYVEPLDPQTGLFSRIAVHSTEKALGFTDTEYAAWDKVLREERTHLVRVAKACIDGNIAERRQAMLESRAELIRTLLGWALKIAGLEVDADRQLQIIAEATRAAMRELPGAS